MNTEEQRESLDFSPEDSRPLMAREGWDEGANRSQKKPTRVNTTRKVCSAILSLRYIIETILLVAILASLVVTRYFDSQNQVETSGDITGFAPTCR
jgi:hypothetical protein